jgi:hypothetical protein
LTTALHGCPHRRNANLAVATVESDFSLFSVLIAFGLRLVIFVPCERVLLLVFGTTGEIVPLTQGYSQARSASVCGAHWLVTLADHVGRFRCRLQRNFGYSATAVHQHFQIIAHRIGLRANEGLW